MPIPPSYCSGGADNTRLIEADVSNGFYDMGGNQIDLGTDGFARLFYRIDNNVLEGNLLVGFKPDAVFPNSGTPFVILGSSLPVVPAVLSDDPILSGVGDLQAGGFGFLNSVGFAGSAVGSATSSLGNTLPEPGVIFFVAGSLGDGGIGNIISDTSPINFGGTETLLVCNIRYEVA